MSKLIRFRLSDSLYTSAVAGHENESDRIRHLLSLGLVTESLILASQVLAGKSLVNRDVSTASPTTDATPASDDLAVAPMVPEGLGAALIDLSRQVAAQTPPGKKVANSRSEAVTAATSRPSATEPVKRQYKADPDPFGDHVTPIGRYVMSEDE